MCFYFFFLFMAAPASHLSSQAMGRIRAADAGLHHSYSNVDRSHICNLHHSSWQRCGKRSLTHWARPRIKPTSSQTLYWILNLLSHSINSCVLFLTLRTFRSSPVAQRVKNTVLSLLWLGWLLWSGFNPWPGEVLHTVNIAKKGGG